MNKKLYIIIATVAAVALIFWWWSSIRQTDVAETLPETSDIEQDLENLDVNNLDNDFEQIDQELDTLQ